MNKNKQLKTYHVLFYKTFLEALNSQESITQECSKCDQLNLVIREEGNMDNPVLLGANPKIKIFAGEAWHTIHDRRLNDGWYAEAQE